MEIPPHVVVEALAGTGKTFTQIVGVAWAFGQSVWDQIERGIAIMAKANPETFHVVPSEEQQLVWDAIALSRETARTITYCAFNKTIVQEFGAKWGWLVRLLQSECGVTLQFATINSLGHQACCRALGLIEVSEGAHAESVLAKLVKKEIRQLRYSDSTFFTAVTGLVSLCKMTMIGWTEENGFDAHSITEEQLEDLADFYEIELDSVRARAMDYTIKVLEVCAEPEGQIDFDDQNWLPIINGYPVYKADLILVDEGQDLNRSKQEFARLCGRRIVLVGDVNQAIYGWAGADVESIPRMRRLLGTNGVPLEPLRLTETRRCGQAIVREAQRIVKDFRAHESNPLGAIHRHFMHSYLKETKDGDMVLCRVNAPLISEALKFMAAGRKVVVRGRDFGQQLIRFVERMHASSVRDLVDKVYNWASKEISREAQKPHPKDSRIIAICDRRACIEALSVGAKSVQDITNKMTLIFTGKECPLCRERYLESFDRCIGKHCQVEILLNPDGSETKVGPILTMPKGVMFSSIHRAKGQEADNVFLLMPKGAEMPHPMARTEWQLREEWNIFYVGLTRAIHNLTYVT